MNSIGGSTLLFEKWRAVANRNPAGLALLDFASGRRWTFRELLRASEDGVDPCPGSTVFARGHHAEFVLEVLRAWRAGAVTCPLESSQAAPKLGTLPACYAHLKLTSASTGQAKCVAFKAEQLAADPANIVATMGLRPEWPNLACISLAHSYGFSNFVLPLVLHGIPLLIVPAPLPEVIGRAAEGFAHLTLAAVPALWRTWHDSRSIPRNVKLAISAGAPLPVELEQQVYADKGLKIHNFYGSSECGGIAYDRSEMPRTDARDAGTALDNVVVSLSTRGNLLVESGSVAESYWPERQANLRAPRFETTDLAEIQEGRVILLGRASDLINIAGRKVAPEGIEAALRQHPSIVECVVFGTHNQPNDRYETIVACVHAREVISVSALARFLSEKLPAWQIPRSWWFTAEIKANERGKLSRMEWRSRFLTAHPAHRDEPHQ